MKLSERTRGEGSIEALASRIAQAGEGALYHQDNSTPGTSSYCAHLRYGFAYVNTPVTSGERLHHTSGRMSPLDTPLHLGTEDIEGPRHPIEAGLRPFSLRYRECGFANRAQRI